MERATSMYKPVATWGTDDVVAWIQGLGECLSPHVAQFKAHCICGSDLLKLNKLQLEYLKVNQLGHQELLLEAVERLSALDLSCSQNPTMSLVSTLSKKASQLITTLDPSYQRSSAAARSGSETTAGIMELSQVDVAADVMTAARSLINWLDRNSTNLVLDYSDFRQVILKDALELSTIPLQEEFDEQKMLEACRRILKQTQVFMSPENFAAVEPIKLHIILLTPSPEKGLGMSLTRTKQGNLVVNKIRPESPAAECGKIRLADELVQINSQNVVGWEVLSVVKLLVASGSEIVLIMKAGLLHAQEEKVDSEEIDEGYPQPDEGYTQPDEGYTQPDEEPTNGIEAEESCDSIDCLAGSSSNSLDRIRQPSMSAESDSDISSPDVVPMLRKNLQRTASNPLLDGNGVGGAVGGARRLSDNLEETDGGHHPWRNRHPSYEALLQRDQDSIRSKESDGQKPVLQVAYRTQVVGGVVMRVPIKEDSANPKSKKRGSGGKKPPKGGKKHNHPTPSSPVDGDNKGGTVVFHDPKEIVVDGHATKQITLTGTGEPQFTSKESPATSSKRSNPALLVPCFQLKDVDHEGWMNKMGGSGFTPKNWRRRWFVLKTGKLYYYKTSFDVSATGIVDLTGYNIEAATDTKRKNCFRAVQEGMRTYYFQTDTSEQMLAWMQRLSATCKALAASSVRPTQSQSIDEAQSEDELST